MSFTHLSSGVTKSDLENKLFFRQTTGLYSTYNKRNLNISGNIYYQFGKNQLGKKVNALLVDAEINYHIWNFTSGLGLSYLSGNSKTEEDQQHDHLFDVLYGARHSFFGAIDYFSSFKSHTRDGGLADYFFKLNIKTNTKTSFTNTAHYFQLAQANENTPRNKNLGFENDFVVKYSFSDWCALECSYILFIPTNTLEAIQRITNNKYSQFMYLQLTVTPKLFSNINTNNQ